MTWLFPPAPLRRLLPDQKRRPAPWIVGLMTFVSLVVGAAGLSILGAVSDLQAASDGRWSLQVIGTKADAAKAEALLAQAPEVARVAPVPEQEIRETLRSWLGPAADTLDLPLPALADVTVRPGTDGRRLGERLQSQVPSARLTPYAQELRPLLGSLQGLSMLVFGLLLVLGAALAAAVTLSARATLEANRATLDVFHGIGATDAQLRGLVQRRIALDALVGGIAGGLAAALVLALALIPARSFLGQLGGSGLLSTTDLLILALLPVVQALFATLVARRALRQALAQSL
jgi:cell division transport system permease protein